MTRKYRAWRKRRADLAGIGSELSINIYDKNHRCNRWITGAVAKHGIRIQAFAAVFITMDSLAEILISVSESHRDLGDLPFPFLYS